MTDHSEVQESIRGYLLGQLSDEERRRVEEWLLTGQDSLEELLVGEEELIEQYLDGSLDGPQRRQFHEHFLSTPERRQNLKFARALRKHVGGGPPAEPLVDRLDAPERRAWWRLPALFEGGRSRWAVPALASVLALVVLSSLWALYAGRGNAGSAFEEEVRRLNAPQGVEGGGLQPPSPAVALSLTAGLRRDSGEMKSLESPGGANVVQLRLVVAPGEYRAYRAALRTVGGPTLVTVPDLTPRPLEGQTVVALNLPAGFLRRGDYQVRLSGLPPGADYEDVGTYFFRVTND